MRLLPSYGRLEVAASAIRRHITERNALEPLFIAFGRAIATAETAAVFKSTELPCPMNLWSFFASVVVPQSLALLSTEEWPTLAVWGSLYSEPALPAS